MPSRAPRYGWSTWASSTRSRWRGPARPRCSTRKTRGSGAKKVMEILVCIKRVPTVGGKIAVTPDGQEVDTRASGFSISPHEECAVEEAVQISERDGGPVSVRALRSDEASAQRRVDLAV